MTLGAADGIPITVIGGYLGSGKTTLLNHALSSTDRRLGVIVNDFGSLDIDAALLGASTDVVSLANGCLCCTLAGGINRALELMAAREPRPDHILIEASGVALPNNITNSITLVGGTVDGIVVLADAERLPALLVDKYVGPTVAAQLGAADIVVLTKTDLVDTDQLATARGLIAENSSVSSVLQASHGNVSVDVLISPPWTSRSTESAEHETVLETRSLAVIEPIPLAQVRTWVADLPRGVVRVKGLVPTPQGIHSVHRVGHRSSVDPTMLTAAHGPFGVVVIAEPRVLDDNTFADLG